MPELPQVGTNFAKVTKLAMNMPATSTSPSHTATWSNRGRPVRQGRTYVVTVMPSTWAQADTRVTADASENAAEEVEQKLAFRSDRADLFVSRGAFPALACSIPSWQTSSAMDSSPTLTKLTTVALRRCREQNRAAQERQERLTKTTHWKPVAKSPMRQALPSVFCSSEGELEPVDQQVDKAPSSFHLPAVAKQRTAQQAAKTEAEQLRQQARVRAHALSERLRQTSRSKSPYVSTFTKFKTGTSAASGNMQVPTWQQRAQVVQLDTDKAIEAEEETCVASNLKSLFHNRTSVFVS
eukprot:TRINITY_DN37400_c0_g1_i1.p1 TRINITY_DN37400_c0_g1~~TRINITY_DN37400_c0_g1_i1.p1  ORF type:complete len:315 (+),score=37.47 TRINITY_DN37400_c0_g1_i1:60-947(+)